MAIQRVYQYCFDQCRIVNSELHHCEGALSSLDNTSAFGSSLFDVWTSFSDT